MSSYAGFKILLDSPAVAPALGFDQFADAFLEIIEDSDPRFAIGVFGGWGSGKTTLIRAIAQKVGAPGVSESVVPVWFNAWRYEREEHMIVPLLDTLRDALVDWADEHKGDPGGVREKAVRAAATAGRAARAIFAGLTLKAKSPDWMGGVDVGFDGSKFLNEIRHGDDEEAAATPQSFYHASFKALKEAFDGFIVDDRDGANKTRDTDGQGVTKRRIVVFVDDLDRCLPLNALEVLESMKLFFDLEGFIFVVALDRDVVERAIEAKYRDRDLAIATPANDEPELTIRGSEYIKKIFQVPFTLPPVALEQLDEFVATLVAGMPAEQIEDLNNRVRPHLDYVVGSAARVNPREVKRFVNAYLLQMKTRPMIQPDVVLAMQTLAFRPDWEDAYEALLAEPDAFADAVRRQLDANPNAVEDLWPELAGVVGDLVEYLGTPQARSLLDAPLNLYIYSVESSRSVDSRLIEVYPRLGSVRRLLRTFDSDGVGVTPQLREELSKELRMVVSVAGSVLTGPTGGALQQSLLELVQEMPESGSKGQDWGPWRQRADTILARLRQRLLSARRASTVGPSSAA